VRASLLFSLALGAVLLPACADAPITPDQLEPDGVLRDAAHHDQAAFSAPRGEMQRASVVALSSVLATQAEGALEDSDHFVASVGVIHLHVRADGIESPRPVSFRWIHGDQAIVVPGTLTTSGALHHAASVEVRPHQVGPWRVEVATDGSSGEPPDVIYSREFTVE
jgi:hypothetical protein